MKNSIVLIIILCFFTHNITKAEQIRTIQSKIILVNKLEQYEINQHIEFQEKLNKDSRQYFEKQSEKFVDNETGFFDLWTEVFYYFESDIKKKTRWKSCIEKYFRTTEFSTYIQIEKDKYVNTINQQRKEQIKSLFYKNNRNDLNLELKVMKTLELNQDVIHGIVEKINQMVLNEVIPEIIDSILGPLFFFPLIIFILGTVFFKYFRFLFCLFLIGYPTYQSLKFSNDLENDLKKTFSEYNDDDLNIIPKLKENTSVYYNTLKKQL